MGVNMSDEYIPRERGTVISTEFVDNWVIVLIENEKGEVIKHEYSLVHKEKLR